jgi:hypothetical protein
MSLRRRGFESHRCHHVLIKGLAEGSRGAGGPYKMLLAAETLNQKQIGRKIGGEREKDYSERWSG